MRTPVRQVALAHQPHAPEDRRQREHDRAEPEELHGEVGDDGTGAPEHVVRPLVGGVVEARVVDRPRRQGDGQGDRAGEEDQAAALRQPLGQEGPQAVDEGVVGRRGTAKGTHAQTGPVSTIR
ncbi:hypothetical protein GCM10025880_50640 [Methylorubrum aminovorans]|nr:hypothetical protein GCM10025880_50640 [Methylorubrum aminovorans]